jgi:ABC-2 type transport system permease protein
MVLEEKMLADTMTVFQKEWKEAFHNRGIRGYLFNWVIMALLIGVYMPITVGSDWFKSPILLLLWSWPPLQLVTGMVADTFAGEKERHTLETLLASRLPDLSIFSGKMMTGLLYAGSLFPASLLLSAVTINLVHPSAEGIQFYTSGVLLQVLGIHYLSLILVALIGTLVSMKSNSVKSAYQKITVVILVLALTPSLGIGLLSPDIRTHLVQIISQPHLGPGGLIAALIMLAADGIIFILCLSNFKRSQLLAA